MAGGDGAWAFRWNNLDGVDCDKYGDWRFARPNVVYDVVDVGTGKAVRRWATACWPVSYYQCKLFEGLPV